jgi:hypothetical protein
MVAFPGAYSGSTPGVVYDIYQGTGAYTVSRTLFSGYILSIPNVFLTKLRHIDSRTCGLVLNIAGLLVDVRFSELVRMGVRMGI